MQHERGYRQEASDRTDSSALYVHAESRNHISPVRACGFVVAQTYREGNKHGEKMTQLQENKRKQIRSVGVM